MLSQMILFLRGQYIIHLPEAYTYILFLYIALVKDNPLMPKLRGSNKTNCQPIAHAIKKEYEQLSLVVIHT